MIFEPPPADDAASEQARLDAIVHQGPLGAVALAGAAVGVVLALWWAFYLLVYLARAA